MSKLIRPPLPLSPINRDEFDIDGMDGEALNGLPFGAIKVDEDGRILFYNKAESLLSGRAPERVIGRRFFHEVAPCTNMPSFYGRFVQAVVREKAQVSFTFVFDFAMRPVRVRIDMTPARESGQYWILVRPVERLVVEERTDAQRLISEAQVRVVGESIDTTVCERELIHVPDAIQPHGVLIAIDREDLTIVAASRNVGDLLGVPLERMLGLPAGEWFEESFLNTIMKATSRQGARKRGATRTLNGGWFSYAAHQSGGSLIVELQHPPVVADSGAYRVDQAHGFLDDFFDVVICAPPSEYVAQEAARMIREFSGFDRVLIYQFDEAGNGNVVAEEKVTDWEQSLVGLNFPANDIPKQARALYLRNRARHIPNNAYFASDLVYALKEGISAPIDLSLSSLRSLSPVHREYLNNMGVVASFSTSILVDGALWGLVIGHHRTPQHLSWETLDAIERAAELLGPRLARSESHDTQAARRRHEETHRAFLEQLAASEHVIDSLARGPIHLFDLFADCAGAAALIGGRLVIVGDAPPEGSVRALIAWLQRSVEEDVWATDCLSGYLPDMHAEKYRASGVMVSFLTPNHEDLLLWFRPEAEEIVVWAGDPNEKAVTDGRLLPRKRFEHWIELKSAHSSPWSVWKLELARRLTHSITAVISAQFVKLQILNEKLEIASSVKDRFLAQMSHELRTPLNAVLGFSELMASGLGGPITAKQNDYLDCIFSAGKHLLSLINDILEMSRLEAGKYETNPVLLNAGQVVAQVLEMLGPQAEKQGVTLRRATDPAEPIEIVTDERSLSQVLMNLISNAVKFTRQDGAVLVDVIEDAETVRFTVTDTGIGMDAETLGAIGSPFYRAQSAYMASPGTGLGLSIVRALVKENGGSISFDSKPGEGTTVQVRLPKRGREDASD